jgi:hypothetical protein
MIKYLYHHKILYFKDVALHAEFTRANPFNGCPFIVARLLVLHTSKKLPAIKARLICLSARIYLQDLTCIHFVFSSARSSIYLLHL